jgi:hypothetical protein
LDGERAFQRPETVARIVATLRALDVTAAGRRKVAKRELLLFTTVIRATARLDVQKIPVRSGQPSVVRESRSLGRQRFAHSAD